MKLNWTLFWQRGHLLSFLSQSLMQHLWNWWWPHSIFHFTLPFFFWLSLGHSENGSKHIMQLFSSWNFYFSSSSCFSCSVTTSLNIPRTPLILSLKAFCCFEWSYRASTSFFSRAISLSLSSIFFFCSFISFKKFSLVSWNFISYKWSSLFDSWDSAKF